MTEFEALLLSCAIEAPTAALFVYWTRWPSRGALHVGAAAAAATAITHPQLWSSALWAYERFSYWPALITLETAVVLVEGCLIGWMAHLRIGRALVVSLICNSASCALGLWLQN